MTHKVLTCWPESALWYLSFDHLPLARRLLAKCRKQMASFSLPPLFYGFCCWKPSGRKIHRWCTGEEALTELIEFLSAYVAGQERLICTFSLLTSFSDVIYNTRDCELEYLLWKCNTSTFEQSFRCLELSLLLSAGAEYVFWWQIWRSFLIPSTDGHLPVKKSCVLGISRLLSLPTVLMNHTRSGERICSLGRGHKVDRLVRWIIFKKYLIHCRWLK